MTLTIAPPTAALVLDEDTLYRDTTLQTASWWDEYVLKAGTYTFEWVTIDHLPWNPEAARTPGYTANIGPYYAALKIPATLVRQHTVSRLFTASSATTTERHLDTVLHRSVYAYQIPGAPRQHGRPLEQYLGGRVVTL